MAVFVIAEAGINHCGDLGTAYRLIEAARDAGANAVKFQTYSADRLEPPGPRRNILKALELTRDQFARIKLYCDTLCIEFMSTPFDVESLEFLVRLGVKRIKIASGQLGNAPLMEAAIKSGLPLIISMGMEVRDDWVLSLTPRLNDYNRIDESVTLLQCTSSYPCPPEDVNLRAMRTFDGGGAWGFDFGLSDHTLGTTAAIAATALGASVIEKHITLDRSMEGPDHHMSTEPDEFAEYVRVIRECETMLGDGIKRVMPSEAKTLEIVKEREAWRSTSGAA